MSQYKPVTVGGALFALFCALLAIGFNVFVVWAFIHFVIKYW